MTTVKITSDNGIDVLKAKKAIFCDPRLNSDSECNSLEERITVIFLTLGFSARIKGYRFLREAVKLVKENPSRIHALTKNVYSVIAENYGVKISTIERAISYALTISFNSGKLSKINDLFYIDVIQENEKPSASEFIAIIAEKLRYENL